MGELVEIFFFLHRSSQWNFISHLIPFGFFFPLYLRCWHEWYKWRDIIWLFMYYLNDSFHVYRLTKEQMQWQWGLLRQMVTVSVTLCYCEQISAIQTFHDGQQGPGEAAVKFVSLLKNVSGNLLSVMIVLEPPRTICVFL